LEAEAEEKKNSMTLVLGMNRLLAKLLLLEAKLLLLEDISKRPPVKALMVRKRKGINEKSLMVF
jgi:hypothetical protein